MLANSNEGNKSLVDSQRLKPVGSHEQIYTLGSRLILSSNRVIECMQLRATWSVYCHDQSESWALM